MTIGMNSKVKCLRDVYGEGVSVRLVAKGDEGIVTHVADNYSGVGPPHRIHVALGQQKHVTVSTPLDYWEEVLPQELNQVDSLKREQANLS